MNFVDLKIIETLRAKEKNAVAFSLSSAVECASEFGVFFLVSVEIIIRPNFK